MANAGFMQKQIGACHKRLYKMPNPPCLIDRRDCITSFNGMSHHCILSPSTRTSVADCSQMS